MPIPTMIACDECNTNGCPPHYGDEKCQPGCMHPSCRARELAAGIEEIGTGGTPAFIRGYNAGYDDAYEHLRSVLRIAHARLEKFEPPNGRGLLFPGAYALDHPAGTWFNCDYCRAINPELADLGLTTP